MARAAVKAFEFWTALVLCLTCAVPVAAAKTSAWYQLTSHHFVVYSDRKPAEARALLVDFERFRSAALTLTGLPSFDESDRVQIFFFNRERDYRKFQVDPHTAGFFRDSWQGPRMVVGAEAKLADASLVLFHEYVHHLMRARSQLRYPLWYEEGFADLLAASVIAPRHVEVGLMHQWRKPDLDRDGLMPVATLLQPDETGDQRYWSRYYASAWLLMHFLQLGPLLGEQDYRAGMASYLLAVHQGADLEAAVTQHFGVAPQVLDAQLKAYRDRRSWLGYRLAVKPYTGPMRERRLSINEAAYILGDLAFRSDRQDTALELLKIIDAKESTVVRPLALRAVIEQHLGRGDLAQHVLGFALQQHKGDPYVLANAAHVYWDKARLAPAGSPERAQLLEKVAEFARGSLDADPANMEAGYFLAQSAWEQGRPEQAITLLNDLYRLHPSDVRLNLELGKLLSRTPQPQRAVPYLERVIAWDHVNAHRAQAQKLLRTLGKEGATPLGQLDEEHPLPIQIQPR